MYMWCGCPQGEQHVLKIVVSLKLVSNLYLLLISNVIICCAAKYIHSGLYENYSVFLNDFFESL